jgi:exodeoxyribonuclease X
VALAAHRAAFEQRYCTPRLAGDVAWICTWKCSLRVWPQLTSFSNQKRRPQGPIRDIGLPAHRAMPDAYVTAHHLRDLLNESSLDQLIAWSQEPGLLPRVRTGAHKGKGWDQLTDEALADLAKDRDVDVRFSATTEMTRRGAGAEARPVEVGGQPRIL